MSSGGLRKASGAVVGTGSAIEIRTVGFRPDSVHLRMGGALGAAGGGAQGMWFKPMPDAAAWVCDNDGNATYVVTAGITPQAEGFDIGTNATINAASTMIFWEAFGTV
jgi:hypothetical protein